ncbi:MAG TPA: PPOX class F420-dependent oxidoreductase [Ktedonobacterales bacterium]|jgi:PPOX class probable F420-dependent enzyme
MSLSAKARQFLVAPHFGALATTDEDGTVQQTAMWYELQDGEIMLNTRVGRRKERNLRRDPRCSLCVVDGYDYVTVSGHVRLIDDPIIAQADIKRLAIRYDGQESGERQARDHFSRERRITIRLAIEHVIESL